MINKVKKGGMGVLIKIAFRNIGRNKRRTAFCLCAVGIACFFIVIYSSLIDGMTKTINEVTQIFEMGHIKIVSAQFDAEHEYMPVQYPLELNGETNWKTISANIKRIPGIREALPRITAMATLQANAVKHAFLWGIDIQAETRANNFNMTDRNDGLLKGRWPLPGANECAIGLVFENKSGLSIGDTIALKTISSEFSDKYSSPKITGVFNFDFIKFDEQFIIVDIEWLQRLLVLDGGTQSLVIFAEDEKTSPFISASVQQLMGKDNVVTDWNDSYWVAMMKMVVPIYMTVFLVFITVASFLIINTVMMIIHERIKEIGMMGSLGMTRTEIVKVFFFESVFLAVFGALAGVAIGGILTGALANFPIRMGDLYGNTFADMPMSNAIFFQFSIGQLASAFALGVFIASLFTLIPSLRSARVEPVEALRR